VLACSITCCLMWHQPRFHLHFFNKLELMANQNSDQGAQSCLYDLVWAYFVQTVFF
jgi:hypothetical protein